MPDDAFLLTLGYMDVQIKMQWTAQSKGENDQNLIKRRLDVFC